MFDTRSTRAYLVNVAAVVLPLISVAGLCVLLYSWWWLSSARAVSAEVIGDLHTKEENLKYVVRYQNDDAQECEAVVKVFSVSDLLHVGQSVDILYQAENTSKVRLNQFSDKWGMGLFLVAWGIVCSTPFWILRAKLRNSANKSLHSTANEPGVGDGQEQKQ